MQAGSESIPGTDTFSDIEAHIISCAGVLEFREISAILHGRQDPFLSIQAQLYFEVHNLAMLKPAFECVFTFTLATFFTA